MNTESQQAQSSRRKIQVGDHAPLFSLPTQSGTVVSLGEFLGKGAVVLYFEDALVGSSALGSKLDFDRVLRIFRQLPRSWYTDQRIKDIAEKYHLNNERPH